MGSDTPQQFDFLCRSKIRDLIVLTLWNNFLDWYMNALFISIVLIEPVPHSLNVSALLYRIVTLFLYFFGTAKRSELHYPMYQSRITCLLFATRRNKYTSIRISTRLYTPVHFQGYCCVTNSVFPFSVLCDWSVASLCCRMPAHDWLISLRCKQLSADVRSWLVDAEARNTRGNWISFCEESLSKCLGNIIRRYIGNKGT